MYTKEKIANNAINLAGLVLGGISVSTVVNTYAKEDSGEKAPLIILGVLMPIGVLTGTPSGTRKLDTFTRGAIMGATAGLAYFVGKKIFDKAKGTAGIGAANSEYYIIGDVDHGATVSRYVFCGWSYPNGEKWAKWLNPYSRWWEYEPKEYKTLKAAEKTVQELIRLGENEWNGDPVTFRIVSWDEYRQLTM